MPWRRDEKKSRKLTDVVVDFRDLKLEKECLWDLQRYLGGSDL